MTILILSQEEIHKFHLPIFPPDLEENLPVVLSYTDPRLDPLTKMRHYFAAVKYTTKQLLTELSVAEDHFLHHTVWHDAVSGKVFIIFHALHEENTHSFVRRSTTRLHSRADFPTFVCNIMENVQVWADENLNRAYRCPRHTQISPQFPYGCQGQMAYRRNCAAILGSPSADHLQVC